MVAPWRTLGIAVAWATAMVVLLAACAGGGEASGRAFEARSDGVLTVATAALPSPGFWELDGAGGYDGFEAGLADELAGRIGLDAVEVVQVPFRSIVAGDLGSADVALSQVTRTAARDEDADFSAPYLEAPPGVLARAGVEARDAQGLQALRWAVTYPSTLASVLFDRIRPAEGPVEEADRSAALDAIRDGRADAYLLDLPVALALADSEPAAFTVLGQLSGDEGLAVVLPDESPNRDAVDAAIRQIRADGTIDRLADRWLGRSGGDVPLIRVSD